ncbi:MAG: hypothetical protein ACXAEF_12370 [Candidatus Thorarchaeota archaeon]
MAEIIIEAVVTILLCSYVIAILVLVDRLRSHIENRIKQPQNLIESNPVNSSLVHKIEILDE